jgi:hypothetical protein
MALWKGIVGEGFAPDAFDAFVRDLNFDNWRPQFVVLHNTAAPRIADWHKVTGEQRMQNLAHNYQMQGWSAGPHLFVADDLIWAFTPLTTPGVHAPSWNSVSWGVEMVGDYSTESFTTGPGLKVQNNTVAALATLHAALNVNPSTLRLHREDPRTTHAGCPGDNVIKADLIERVRSLIAARRAGTGGGHRILRLTIPHMHGEDVKAVQEALISAGIALKADGDFGAATETAVKAFQQKKRLTADGVVGPATLAALHVS